MLILMLMDHQEYGEFKRECTELGIYPTELHHSIKEPGCRHKYMAGLWPADFNKYMEAVKKEKSEKSPPIEEEDAADTVDDTGPADECDLCPNRKCRSYHGGKIKPNETVEKCGTPDKCNTVKVIGGEFCKRHADDPIFQVWCIDWLTGEGAEYVVKDDLALAAALKCQKDMSSSMGRGGLSYHITACLVKAKKIDTEKSPPVEEVEREEPQSNDM